MTDHAPEPLKPGPDAFRILADRLKAVMKEELDITLRYDAESIEYLDGYIQRNKAKLPKHEGLVNLIGSFLGECLIATYGGKWAEDEKQGWGVCIENEFTAFPFNKVGKRFKPDGDHDSIISFYTTTSFLLKEHREKHHKAEGDTAH